MSTTVTGSGITTPLVTADDIAVDTSTIVVDATNNRLGVNNASPAKTLDVSGDVAVDTDTFVVDSTNDRVGINKASPTVALDVTGAITASGTITGNAFSGDGSSLTGISAGLWSDLGSRDISFGQATLNENGTLVTISAGSSSARYVRGTLLVAFASSVNTNSDYLLTFKQKSGWLIVAPNSVYNTGSLDTTYRQWPAATEFTTIPAQTYDNGTVTDHISERLPDGKYTETSGTLTTHVNALSVDVNWSLGGKAHTIFFEGYMETNGEIQWGVDDNTGSPIEKIHLTYMLIDV